MAPTNGPLDGLIDWVGTGAGGRTGRRIAAAWSAENPALAGYVTPAEMVRAGWADPDRARILVAALAALPDEDRWASLTALAILVPRLSSIAVRWSRAGVAAVDRSDLEADLLAEVLSELRRRPVAAPERIVGLAWARVRLGRQRQLRRRPVVSPERIVGLAWARVRLSRQRQLRRLVNERELVFAHHLQAAACRVPAEAAAALIVNALRSGRLSVPTARAVYLTGVVGWSASEAALKLGCHPHAVRARRCRAIRLLAA